MWRRVTTPCRGYCPIPLDLQAPPEEDVTGHTTFAP